MQVQRLRLLGSTWLVSIAALASAGLACSTGGDTGGSVLADRLLRLREPAGTKLEVRAGELPADLRAALNPDAKADAPASELTSIPVYPGAKLRGSFRLERPDGTVEYSLLYDVEAASGDVETAVAKLVNETPWQTVGGQSSDAVAALRFQNTSSGTVSGIVGVQHIETAAGAKPLTSLIYIVQIEPKTPPKNEPYKVPPARPIPDGFPKEFVFDGLTPISVLWESAPRGKTYQMQLLTKQSSLDVTERYRDIFKRAGWTLSSDDARGFATTLEFEKDGGTSQASVSIDAFEEDAAYTAVVFQLRLAR